MAQTLPLGVDIGATRVRIAQLERVASEVRVRAVAVRDAAPGSCSSGELSDPEYVAALLEDALNELGTNQRRCVCALGQPDAILRPLKFPKMTGIEREKAAKFEVQRLVDYPSDDAVVRLHPIDTAGEWWALGMARSSAVTTRVHAVRAAGLKITGIDHEALALTRCFPSHDAVVDVGHQRTSIHVAAEHLPATFHAYNGGADVTRGIERELSIDEQTAEKRKRILGTAGAGERAREALVADIAALFESARAVRTVVRVAIVGNASRLSGLVTDLENVTGVLCETPVSDVLRSDGYPDDVLRSSAPDWTLAAGLALWSVA